MFAKQGPCCWATSLVLSTVPDPAQVKSGHAAGFERTRTLWEGLLLDEEFLEYLKGAHLAAGFKSEKDELLCTCPWGGVGEEGVVTSN